MEAIQKTIDDLSQHFQKTMADFQENLHSAIPATSPTSNIVAQFSSFRNFVMLALKNLQGQVEILNRQMDQWESRSRRKILLIHGVPESEKEDVPATVVRTIKHHLHMPEFSAEALSRCHRMGKSSSDRPRALLVKFHELPVRNKVWYNKKQLKGTGITLAEFLTKSRHEVFMAARLKLGISKCWSKDGLVIVIGPDSKRHTIVSKTELSTILGVNDGEGSASASTVYPSLASAPKQQAGHSQRSKRTGRK